MLEVGVGGDAAARDVTLDEDAELHEVVSLERGRSVRQPNTCFL